FIADGDEELSWYYSAADVFMFPSLTDTFGLVMLEALACGVPVAAFPVPGPLDVINGAPIGVLSDDLADAARRALSIKPEPCRAYALKFSWQSVADEFLGYLHPIEGRL
ncbi:MAG: glycosyltransferase, partial [Amphiplicatus sp.]